MLNAAPPPRFAESLWLSGQCHSPGPPPSRLEGSAFQPARRRFFRTHALREGRAFPHDRRQSRRSSPTGSRAIWTSLGLAILPTSHLSLLSMNGPTPTKSILVIYRVLLPADERIHI